MPKIPKYIRATASSPKKLGGARRSIPDSINLPCTYSVRAGPSKKGVGGGERISLLANTGRRMQLEGFFDDVVIDLKGARFARDVTPIIGDHDTTRRIGQTTDQIVVQAGEVGSLGNKTIKGPAIAASGIRSSTMQRAKGIIDDMKNGYPFQVSVGAKIDKGFYVEAGDSVEVNGKTWKGPIIVASKTTINELSILVLGADNRTSAELAAKIKLPRKETSMNFSAYVRSLGFDPKTLNATQKKNLMAQFKKLNANPDPGPRKRPVKKSKVTAGARRDDDDDGQDHNPVDDLKVSRKKMASESKRISGIEATASSFRNRNLRFVEKDEAGEEVQIPLADITAKAIEEGWSLEKFELECRRADLPTADRGPGIHSKDSNLNTNPLEIAILRAAGVPMSDVNEKTKKKFGVETLFSDKDLEASDDPKYRNIASSIDGLLDAQIRAAGKYPTSRSGSELWTQALEAHNVIKAAPASTLNLTYIFENVMHKASLSGFQSAEGVGLQLCGRRPVNDFKPHYLYRLEHSGSYKKVGQDGELKHVSMVDSKYTITADTYGCMIAIDRKTQINDDLGLVVNKAASIGILGAQRVEESIFTLLLSNPGSFFSSGNGNLQTGGGSPLSFSSLEIARLAFRNQVVNGKPVTVRPQILLVGTVLETLAGKIFSNDRLQATGDTDARVFVDNEFKGLYRPIVSPYLNNTGIVDQDGSAISGQSGTQWYLFGPPSSPQGSAMVIAFLNGRETPYFDRAETTFNVPGGIQMRSYFDWGVAMHVYQMAYKSAGA